MFKSTALQNKQAKAAQAQAEIEHYIKEMQEMHQQIEETQEDTARLRVQTRAMLDQMEESLIHVAKNR